MGAVYETPLLFSHRSACLSLLLADGLPDEPDYVSRRQSVNRDRTRFGAMFRAHRGDVRPRAGFSSGHHICSVHRVNRIRKLIFEIFSRNFRHAEEAPNFGQRAR